MDDYFHIKEKNLTSKNFKRNGEFLLMAPISSHHSPFVENPHRSRQLGQRDPGEGHHCVHPPSERHQLQLQYLNHLTDEGRKKGEEIPGIIIIIIIIIINISNIIIIIIIMIIIIIIVSIIISIIVVAVVIIIIVSIIISIIVVAVVIIIIIIIIIITIIIIVIIISIIISIIIIWPNMTR